MSFAARETSRTQGAPFALFLFKYGPNSGDVLGYTSSEDPITTGAPAVTYLPVAMHNDSIAASGALDKVTMDLHLDKTLPISQMMSGFPPSYVVTLRIFQGHVGETEFAPIWSGRILGTRREGDEAIFTCEPTSTAMRRSGLRRNWQYSCPHVLYGPQCGADKPSKTITVIVSSVENPYVELPAAWNGSVDTSLYVNGDATWTDGDGIVQLRSILRITSPTEIQLDGDCSTMVAATSLTLVQSCDHQMDGCIIHANINNFGGCPWIPTDNPIGIQDNFT